MSQPTTLARLVLPDVQELLSEGTPAQVAHALRGFHAADVAGVLDALEDELAWKLLLALEPVIQAQAFERLEPPRRLALAERLGSAALAPIVARMSSDDRADFIAALSDEVRAGLLALLPASELTDVARLVTYPEDTAGGRMTSEHVELRPEWTVEEAVAHVRKVAADRETIVALYVTGADRRLEGVVTVRKLLLAPAGKRVREIMISPPISVPVEADQETVARQLAHYDFVAIPVVDSGGRMLGIVTVDDALDVAQEEATEDAHMMGAVVPLEDPYLATSLLTLVRKRATWLSILFVAGLGAGTVLSSFQGTLQRSAALLFFVPLLIAAGGNSGGQSATLVTRALAMGEVRTTDGWRVVRREAASGLLLGSLLGLYGFVVSWLRGHPAWKHVGATVWVTLVTIVVAGSLLGSVLPLLMKRLGIDPAITSAPLVCCLLDIVGILIYVSAATLILPAV